MSIRLEKKHHEFATAKSQNLVIVKN